MVKLYMQMLLSHLHGKCSLESRPIEINRPNTRMVKVQNLAGCGPTPEPVPGHAQLV